MDQPREQSVNKNGRKRPSSRALWFGLLSGPVVWSIEFLAVYLLVEVACQAGIFRSTFLGIELITLLVAVLTIIALLVVGYGAYFSYRVFQQMGGRSLFRRESLDRSPAWFMALSGLALSLLFGLLILMMGIPALVLSPCIR